MTNLNDFRLSNVQDKITRWNVNFVAPIVNEEKIFRTAQNKLLEKRNQLINYLLISAMKK